MQQMHLNSMYWWSPRARALKSRLQNLMPALGNHLVCGWGTLTYNHIPISFIWEVCPDASANFSQLGKRNLMMLNAGPGIFGGPHESKHTCKSKPQTLNIIAKICLWRLIVPELNIHKAKRKRSLIPCPGSHLLPSCQQFCLRAIVYI